MAQRIPVQQLLSDRARAYILARWIDTGAGWVDALPQRVEDLLRDWDLDFVESLSGGRSCVLSVRTAEGEPGVLKVAVVDRWALREAIALRHWSSTRHAPSVRRVGDGALVLEHVAGRPLSRSDRDLLPAAAQMLAAAARNDSPPPGIPRLDPQRTMAVAARQAAGRLPERWAVNAAERASQLLQEAPAVLCHADLVPSNLLATARGMVKLIDPEPRLAPLSYDLALLAYRFAEGEDFHALAAEIASAAGVPTAEVLAWGPVHAYAQSAWRPDQQNADARELLRELDH